MHASSSGGTAEAEAEAAAAAALDPASCPRKADGPSMEYTRTMGSPTDGVDGGAASAMGARAKRATKPPASYAAEQAAAVAAAAAPGKRKRESSMGAFGSPSFGGGAAAGVGAGKRASAARRKRAKAASGAGVDPYSLTRCEICAGADHDDKILLCDECDQGFHIFCLSPPLAQIPATDW